jgi:hypothetical protein
MKVTIESGSNNTTLWVILVAKKINTLIALGLKENSSTLTISLYSVAILKHPKIIPACQAP